MRSQQCQKCAAGTYSLGTGVAFDEWDALPSGFITHGVNGNGEDTATDCSKSVYAPRVLHLYGSASPTPDLFHCCCSLLSARPGPPKAITSPPTQTSARRRCPTPSA